MQKFLFITPASIAGEHIIKGLAKGFKSLGCQIYVCDVRDLNQSFLNEFNPDFTIGYDYAHFYDDNAEKLLRNTPVIHYFADNPNSSFSNLGSDVYFKKLSDSNNLVFCWEKTYLDAFNNKAYYLPLAVNVEDYAVNGIKVNDKINFVGRPLGKKRQEIIAQIVQNYPYNFELYCHEKHFYQSIEEFKEKKLLSKEDMENYKKSYNGFLKTTDDIAKVYANSAISLNITIQGQNNMNYRVFEVLGSKGLLLTDKMNDTIECFKNNGDIVIYEKSDLLEKINKYINNPKIRANIIKNGYKTVMRSHTFSARAKDIISILK